MAKAKLNTIRKKNCNKGWNCGATCITKQKLCRKLLSKDGKQIAINYGTMVKIAKGKLGRDAANITKVGGGSGGPSPAPTKPPVSAPEPVPTPPINSSRGLDDSPSTREEMRERWGNPSQSSEFNKKIIERGKEYLQGKNNKDEILTSLSERSEKNGYTPTLKESDVDKNSEKWNALPANSVKDAVSYLNEVSSLQGGVADINKFKREGTKAFTNDNRELNVGVSNFGGISDDESIPQDVRDNARDRERKTMFHELSHHMELDHPELGLANKVWLKERSGDTETPLRYDGAKKFDGNFYQEYVGRTYRKNRQGFNPTEVLPTGVQQLTSDERYNEIKTKDTEHLERVVGALLYMQDKNKLNRENI